MKYHSLTKDVPFETLDIPYPVRLETAEDYAQLMQHMVSTFRPALNICYRQYGYEVRLEILMTMVQLLSDIMPERNPDFIANYPDSIEDIYALLGNFLVMSAGGEFERRAG